MRLQEAIMQPVFASRHTLAVAVINEWASMASIGRRSPQLGAGVAQSTHAMFSICEATEEMCGLGSAEWQPTDHITTKDCWMVAVTATLFHVQGAPAPCITGTRLSPYQRIPACA